MANQWTHALIEAQWLLNLLWDSREVQRTWQSSNIIAIGRRFVQARYLNKDRRSHAIRLCEDIYDNLRHAWGSLNPKALEMSDLLSELYTSEGHYRESQGVHENILRLVTEGDDGDDRTLDELSPHDARKQLDLLRQSYLRLQGWDKSAANYKAIVDELIQMYKGKPEWKDVKSIDTWNFSKEKPSETFGKFAPPKNWEFASSGDLDEQGNAHKSSGPRRPGMGVKRATSNWGIDEVRRVLHGFSEKVNGTANGVQKQQALPAYEDEDGYESATEQPKANGIKV